MRERTPESSISDQIRSLDVSLERDVFLRQLVGQLAVVLEDVVGIEEARGFVSLVGQQVGDWIDGKYRQALSVPKLSREQVAQVLVDLKRRIEGDFYIIEESDEKLVLGNRRCPFGDRVVGKPSLCMMTSNVFGIITAENLGYAKVDLQETIAEGSPGCRVTIYLRPSDEATGTEYFPTIRQD